MMSMFHLYFTSYLRIGKKKRGDILTFEKSNQKIVLIINRYVK
jgi:hypothetical protein